MSISYRPSRRFAKRGDLIFLKFDNSYTIQRQPGRYERVEETQYDLHKVTSVTRKTEDRPAMVKAVVGRSPGAAPQAFYDPNNPHVRLLGLTDSFLLPAEDFDVEALWTEACAHTYPRYDTPMRWTDRKEIGALIHAHVHPDRLTEATD